jgi:hypothetical protein
MVVSSALQFTERTGRFSQNLISANSFGYGSNTFSCNFLQLTIFRGGEAFEVWSRGGNSFLQQMWEIFQKCGNSLLSFKFDRNNWRHTLHKHVKYRTFVIKNFTLKLRKCFGCNRWSFSHWRMDSDSYLRQIFVEWNIITFMRKLSPNVSLTKPATIFHASVKTFSKVS